MDAVASAAGMKKANLFHYYPTKESLELAVLDHAAQGMNERIAHLARHAYDPVGAVQLINYPGFNDFRKHVNSKTDELLGHTDQRR